MLLGQGGDALGDLRSTTARQPPQLSLAQQDVVGDAELADQREVLMHHGDAVSGCDARRGQVHRLPGQPDLSRLGRVEASQQGQQRALARAVFADQRVDLAGCHLQAGTVASLHAGEALAQAAAFNRQRR